MWYKIPFTYKGFSAGHVSDQGADLFLNLPQVELNEAKKNLFVRDVVRHPLIKSCYRGDESFTEIPEDVLQYCDQDLNVNTLIKVPVRYQRDPVLVANMGYSFVFHVYIDNHGTANVGLPRVLEFTCRSNYDYYYDAFMNDLLVDNLDGIIR